MLKPSMLDLYTKHLIKSRGPYMTAVGLIINFGDTIYRYSAFLYLLKRIMHYYPGVDLAVRNFTLSVYVSESSRTYDIPVKEVFFNCKVNRMKFFATSASDMATLEKVLRDFEVTFGIGADFFYE